jgi:hypothetical protein
MPNAGVEATLAADMFSVGIGDPVVLEKANFAISGLKDLSVKTLLAKLEQQSSRKAAV